MDCFPSRGMTQSLTHECLKATCYSILVVNSLFYSSGVIASALSCRPYVRIWDRRVPGTCINTMILDMASSAFNVISDVAILALPQNIIWRLQMTTRRKIGLSLIFAIGLMYAISAIC